MKSVITRLSAVFASLLLGACAGLEPIPDSAKTFDAVYEANGANKDVIYNGAKLWIAENFRSAKSVIDLENKEDGLIIAKGNIKYPCDDFDCRLRKSQWRVSFTMRIDVKEQRFKLTFSNLILARPLEEELWMQGDMDAIRPKLLEIGPQIQASLAAGKLRKEW